MNPEQPALRSNAPADAAPSASWTRLAVDGKAYSGVAVATMIRSSRDGGSPATIKASRPARAASSAVVSRSLLTTWRSLMPVMRVIQSSLVSTTRASASFVRTFSGT